jgi:hypothetical protein
MHILQVPGARPNFMKAAPVSGGIPGGDNGSRRPQASGRRKHEAAHYNTKRPITMILGTNPLLGRNVEKLLGVANRTRANAARNAGAPSRAVIVRQPNVRTCQAAKSGAIRGLREEVPLKLCASVGVDLAVQANFLKNRRRPFHKIPQRSKSGP